MPAREDLLGPSRVEGQVARPRTPARRPKPAAAAGEAARNDSPRPAETLAGSPRSPRSAHRDRPATGARAGRRASARTEPGWPGTPRPGAARPGPRPIRQDRARQRSDRCGPRSAAYAAANTDSRAEGSSSSRSKDTHRRSILRLGPLRQQGRLAITRRRSDTDHPTIASREPARSGRRDSPTADEGPGPKASRRAAPLQARQPSAPNRPNRRSRASPET